MLSLYWSHIQKERERIYQEKERKKKKHQPAKLWRKKTQVKEKKIEINGLVEETIEKIFWSVSKDKNTFNGEQQV